MAIELPEGFSCPITRRVMEDPVYLTSDSRTYERAALEEWFSKGGRLTSPSTGRKIKSADFQADHGLRKDIKKFLERYPQFVPKAYSIADEVEQHRLSLKMSAMSIEGYEDDNPGLGQGGDSGRSEGAYYQEADGGRDNGYDMDSPGGRQMTDDGDEDPHRRVQAGGYHHSGVATCGSAGGSRSAGEQQLHHAQHQARGAVPSPHQQAYEQQQAQQAQLAQQRAYAKQQPASHGQYGGHDDPRSSSNDDERKEQPQHSTGFHSFLASGTKFIIDSHYKPLKPVGTGAYGIVVAAQDTRGNTKVAIKKISNAFDDVIDAKRILREIKLLAHFDHENVVALLDLVPPLRKDNFEDVYMVMGFMETDLHKIIYSKNPLSEEHCQYFIYQVLRGTKYIHSANVIHRDLKPSNLLLNQNCDLKICDLGLARGVDNSSNFDLTEYVVTRWYRAPEIMCSCQEYDRRIDVWSIGCILGEILGRKPLFPGENYIHQLNLIFKYLGTPKPEDLAWITNDKALTYIRDQPHIETVPWKSIFPDASDCSLDLLSKMLVFNPNKRISVECALRHPFLKQLHNPDDEPVCDIPFDFDFEKDARTDKGIRRLMYEEVMNSRRKKRTIVHRH